VSKSDRSRVARVAQGAGGGSFARRLIDWYRRHGRHDLPWQRDRDPYRVWLSEIMLQQTQVATVLPYYERFLQRFPAVQDLARAAVDEVMAAWSGLGYYARARNLHACARRIVDEHGGRFPRSGEALGRLPGIGPSTAAAIAAFCFDERGAILDGNVRRVLARHWAIEGYPGRAAVQNAFWDRAREELPASRSIGAYTQAIMDLGATVCTRTRPSCERCPVQSSCQARRQARIDEFPAPRPQRERPQRTEWVLIALSRGRVLLQRRPSRGIWGGLMCLPHFDALASLRRYARGLRAGASGPVRMAARRHELTHLSLALRPYRLEANLAANERRDGPDGARWLTLEAAGRAGMPAPHRVLLMQAAVAAGRPRIRGSTEPIQERPR